MMGQTLFAIIIFYLLFLLNVPAMLYSDSPSHEYEECFCMLEGPIDDCACDINTVDQFNNVKLYPRLRTLLQKDYFRFFRVNLYKKCPFWQEQDYCAIKYCHVQPCKDNEVPKGLKQTDSVSDSARKTENKYTKDACKDKTNDLGDINPTISDEAREDFRLWGIYDDSQDNFCILDDYEEDSNYVDLLLNPERYTGFKGVLANNIWDIIYKENCFRPNEHFNRFILSQYINELCLEQRVFYRAISGLHASINIHVCAKFLLKESSLKNPNGEWGPSKREFRRKFSRELTNGEGPEWLRNLYFLYLLELKALKKVSMYLQTENFYTGNESEDWDTQLAVYNLLEIVENFPYHFDETNMFLEHEGRAMKLEFKQHFRNISAIMDCVGCEKCRLWGKLQIQGLGTALKILFADQFDKSNIKKQSEFKPFQLVRTEIVALLNSIGRLSASIYELDEFRYILR